MHFGVKYLISLSVYIDVFAVSKLLAGDSIFDQHIFVAVTFGQRTWCAFLTLVFFLYSYFYFMVVS
jgi:hypothetical protein